MLQLLLRCGVLLLFVVVIRASDEGCPRNCKCSHSKDNPDVIRKVKCGGGETDKIHDLEDVDLHGYSLNEVLLLNLSDNLLTSFAPDVPFVSLQKLDLSKNQLTQLEANQFANFPKLQRLDLSGNFIKKIDFQAFTNLERLERLKLNQNLISTIIFGTFGTNVNLKQLDISENPLTCDCSLLWLLDWSQKLTVKLFSNPKCNSPDSFKGHSLRKLRIGIDITCKSPAASGGFVINMKPKENQVVFEGDTFKLQCHTLIPAETYDDSPRNPRFEWKFLDSDPKLLFRDIAIERSFVPSTGMLNSVLHIKKLEKNHTGVWNCSLVSFNESNSKGITLVVISDDTEYCPIDVTSNNKGTYSWPRTIVNNTVSVPCESVNLNNDLDSQKATYFCNLNGTWQDFDTRNCGYVSETTKILEHFTKINASLENARHFKNYTAKTSVFQDVMDVVFAVQTIENYVTYCKVVEEHRVQLGTILMDVVNNLLDLPKAYLREADTVDDTCKKLRDLTETLATFTASPQLHKSNIDSIVFPAKKEGFSGIKCTWYSNPENKLDRPSHCVTNSQSDAQVVRGKFTEASITIPEIPFETATNKAFNILISMQANSRFFPIDQNRYGKEDVTSVVIGAKIDNVTVRNLTNPIDVMLQVPSVVSYEVVNFIPVWWDPALNNGSGSWSSDGCEFSHEFQEHIIFYCYHLSYYGLLQDVSSIVHTQIGAKFKFSHPAIYVGSFILFTSLIVAITTYLLCYSFIQMPKKTKHSLINMWVAISLLCFMYVFGIYQTEDAKICQVVGMVLHYFTLSSLLWMCVGINCMYKRLSKNDIIELQDDELPSDQPVRKPILGLYLVGWGIALIICGISAAINIKDYTSNTHCFLRTGPALSALYVPFVILVLFLTVHFLLIRCTIYSSDANGHLSEGTQATENVDLDLLEPNFPITESRSIRSTSTKTASSEVEDQEHAPSAQLKAYVIFLFLYILTWLACAFATVEPFNLVSFEEDLFSIAYAVLATMLGAFTLFFYCVARNDVRTHCIVLNRYFKQRRFLFRSRNVSDAAPNIPQIQIQPLPLPPVNSNSPIELPVTRSSSRSSHTKSNSNASNVVLKAACDLNGSYTEPGAKINNVNLVVLHRQQYRTHAIPNIIENPTSAAEVFYNPHQSTVARKFFKRQKRNMMKRNNLTVIRPDQNNSDAALSDSKPNNSDQSIFGTNSKVNNTNIHVEKSRKVQNRNPNIFSDSAEEYDSVTNVPVENIVINAERLRKKEMLRHGKARKKVNIPLSNTNNSIMENNMRSVSQQCTLEYSSENISDSILDKGSPDKTLLPPQSSPSVLTEDDPLYCKINEPPLKKPPNIYVNPSHDFVLRKNGAHSRASSVSVSDLDELYQQIRRGPKSKLSHSHIYVNNNHRGAALVDSSCLSDSEINSYHYDEERPRRKLQQSFTNESDVETTV